MKEGNEFRFQNLVLAKLDQIIRLLKSNLKQEVIMSQEMTQAVQNIVDAVTAETDVITSGEKLLTDLFTQLEAVIQEVKDDPANVAKLDDLVATVNAKKEELAAAIVANTPAAPPPAPAA